METPQDLTAFSAVILPGSKNTRFDLEWLEDQRLEIPDRRLQRRRRPRITGICGGYQMMGTRVHDPDGLRRPTGSNCNGLGLLPVDTVLQAPKTTTLSRFSWNGIQGNRL